MCDCNNRLADIASMGARQLLLPLVSRLGLEPRCQLRRRILSPILIAVSVFRPRHYFIPVRCVYQFRQRLIFRNLKSFADLRHTLCLTFTYIQPMGRHGLSFEERPLTSGPSLSTKSHAGLVYLQLSPAIQNCYLITNHPSICYLRLGYSHHNLVL